STTSGGGTFTPAVAQLPATLVNQNEPFTLTMAPSTANVFDGLGTTVTATVNFTASYTGTTTVSCYSGCSGSGIGSVSATSPVNAKVSHTAGTASSSTVTFKLAGSGSGSGAGGV